MAVKSVVLERVCVVEEIAVASLAVWTLQKIDMVRKRDESLVSVGCLKTDLAAANKQVSGQVTLQSELRDAQDASFWLDAR